MHLFGQAAKNYVRNVVNVLNGVTGQALLNYNHLTPPVIQARPSPFDPRVEHEVFFQDVVAYFSDTTIH